MENDRAKRTRKTTTDVHKSLMDMLPGGIVGLSIADQKLLFASEGMFTLLGYQREDVQALEEKGLFQCLLHPEDCLAVLRLARKQLLENGRVEISYRLLKKDGTPIWVKQYGGLIESAEWGTYFLCQILDHSETRFALEEAQAANKKLETLMDTIPGGVAQLLVEDDFRIGLASDGFYRMTGYSAEECMAAPVFNKAINLVKKEDIPQVLTAFEKLLVNKKPVSVDYRIIKKDGSTVWNTAYAAKTERVGQQTIMDAVFIDTTIAKRNERRLVSLINSIPGGVARLHVSDDAVIDYANDRFYEMTGYTAAEFSGAALAGRYCHIVHPDDRAMVMEKVSCFVNSKITCPSLDYRILHKNGEVRWMRASASRVNSGVEAYKVAQCIVLDVTEEKRMAKIAAMNEERYRIIAEQTQDVVYDWDLESGFLNHSPVYRMKFGYELPADFPIQDLMTTDFVHHEDRDTLATVMEDMKSGMSYREAEYRVKKADGTYIWCRNRMTAIFDEDHKPIQVVGMLTDIDAYKKATVALLEKAQQDSLTGLLNRMTVQEQVEARLQQSAQGLQHAFFLIDIDNFKWVNDSLGHITGDEILLDISARLSSQFRREDITGRLGGDEFVVFMEDVSCLENVREKAEQLNEMYRQTYRREGAAHQISISIGIALYPTHGQDFESLYRHADKALYESKRRGRDRFSLYTPTEVDVQEQEAAYERSH